MVRWFFGLIFSLLFLSLVAFAQDAGGKVSVGCSSGASSTRSKACNNRISMNEISLYANCWPRQIRGPALKGKKIKGFGVRYLWSLSSRNRSGSNSIAYNIRISM